MSRQDLSPRQSLPAHERLKHDPEKAYEKACPGLDPGWKPVFGKDHASHKIQTSRSPRPSNQIVFLQRDFLDVYALIRRSERPSR
jgi:hypothetical protein